MIMKKLLALLLSLVTVLGLFAGCTINVNTQPEARTPTTAPTAAPTEPTTPTEPAPTEPAPTEPASERLYV